MNGGNPQGKGLVPVLDAWHDAQPAVVEAKRPRRILEDYFTSMLVLSAEFAFNPRRGVNYYLYLAGGNWRLSLIDPREWGNRNPGACLAECQLQDDMTWQLTLQPGIHDQPQLIEALRAFHDGFATLLERDTPLEENLPYCVPELPYYRRLAAAGLSSSLSRSLKLSGMAGHSGKKWLAGLDRISLAAPIDWTNTGPGSCY